MNISEQSRVIVVAKENFIQSDPSQRYNRAIVLIERLSQGCDRVTVDCNGFSMCNYAPNLSGIYQDSIEQISKEISEGLNGKTYFFDLEVNDSFVQRIGKEARRRKMFDLNRAKFDEILESVDPDLHGGFSTMNVVVLPNRRAERIDQLNMFEQLNAYFKRHPKLEQTPKSRRRNLITDTYLNIWLGELGGVDDISRTYYGAQNKFCFASVLF